MRQRIYDIEDLKKVANGEMSIQECANKTHTSVRGTYHALYRYGLYIRKIRIKITTPFKTIITTSIEEASKELQCSRASIKNALSGKKVSFMERENIKVELYDEE